MAKLGELCGKTVSLRCQLPTEDLDALVTITCDEDLTNLIEEYDRTASLQSIKIRAFLSNPKKCSPAHSTASGSGTCGSSSSTGTPEASPKSLPLSVSNRCVYTSCVYVVKIAFKSSVVLQQISWKGSVLRLSKFQYVLPCS
ncbi:putative PB1 domain-containing protein [Helianthus annuus]|nr:putative PB1 domain-containing protein [Helianthus annuus]KAJ0663166.1 putative PB1 domain-containing protein [Helianthus annuus]KAJ0857546.1 putative PB1 domain-containing protein [Helianthus annuus]